MKKVLYATTALVAFAGAAAAEVTITGSAEMGIVGGGLFATNGSLGEPQFWQDVDVTFSMTGESDMGLSFGASVDLDEADWNATGASNNLDNSFEDSGFTVFISGNFGTLTMGDTDGALDWALTDAGNVGNPGSIDDAETSHAGYMGTYGDGAFDGQILRYDYSFGDFGIAVSVEQGALGAAVGLPGVVLPPTIAPGNTDGAYAIGARYALNLGATTVNLGAGFHNADFGTGTDQKIWGLSAAAEFGGGFQGGIVYSDWQDFAGIAAFDVSHIGVGLGYESGPVSVHANYGQFDLPAGFTDIDGWGIAAAYDLGGGLSVNAAYADSDIGIAGLDFSTWSLGMVMSF